jgi:hypothetical protein
MIFEPFARPICTTKWKVKRNQFRGPYPLTASVIDSVVTLVSPGVFVFGQPHGDSDFDVICVGRSDTDVRAELKQHIDSYSAFKFEYCSTSIEAFEVECLLYHAFDPPDNKTHPSRPRGSFFKCPRCKAFG